MLFGCTNGRRRITITVAVLLQQPLSLSSTPAIQTFSYIVCNKVFGIGSAQDVFTLAGYSASKPGFVFVLYFTAQLELTRTSTHSQSKQAQAHIKPKQNCCFTGKKILDRCVNDPSAGSPTETLLRLHLPLNDKV